METLKRLREELNLSMDEIAEKLGMSTSMYEKIEYGYRVPSRRFVESMKKTFPFVDTNIFFGKEVHKIKTNEK